MLTIFDISFNNVNMIRELFCLRIATECRECTCTAIEESSNMLTHFRRQTKSSFASYHTHLNDHICETFG